MYGGEAIVEHIDGMEKYKGTWARRPRNWIQDYPMPVKKKSTSLVDTVIKEQPIKANIKIWTCGWQTKALYVHL